MFLILIIFSINVYADSCSNDELKRLKNIAEQVDITYEYEMKNKVINKEEYVYVDFTIVASNLNKELQVNHENDYLQGDYKEFKNDGKNFGRISGFIEGEKVTITIRAYTSNDCSGRILMKKTIKLPYYNYWKIANSTYYMCKNYPEFKYCKELVDDKIEYEKFVDELNKYVSSLNVKENNDVSKDTSSDNNYYMIIGIVGGILLVFIIIYVIWKKQRKNSL